MAVAKLSHSAAASLAFVKKLQNEETHALVRKEVFTQVKAAFGIPEKHKIKVELSPEAANYLEIVRKTDGSKYELNAQGKWVGAAQEAVPAEDQPKPAYAKIDNEALKDFAVELVEGGDATLLEPRLVGNGQDKVITLTSDAQHTYVRVDKRDINEF